MSRRRPARAELRRWLHDRVCVGATSPDPYCTGSGADEHARTQDANARRLMACSTREEVARELHHQACTVWIQQAHGGVYVELARNTCGPDGAHHVERLIGATLISELCEMIGIVDNTSQVG
ncbi:hypothetical protein SEA_MINIBOSS_4 [Mycobacterium phage MiniBoss]|nr:hypothetical protein SEA_MINIBOSS_4 [Mycobacterium phage MiniBoss]